MPHLWSHPKILFQPSILKAPPLFDALILQKIVTKWLTEDSSQLLPYNLIFNPNIKVSNQLSQSMLANIVIQVKSKIDLEPDLRSFNKKISMSYSILNLKFINKYSIFTILQISKILKYQQFYKRKLKIINLDT